MRPIRILAASFAIVTLLCLAGCSTSAIAPDVKIPDVDLTSGIDFGISEEEVETKAEEAKQATQPETPENTSTGNTSGNVSSVSPSQGSNVSNSNASNASTSTAGSNATPSTPSAPAHQHSWTYHDAQYNTIWHDAVTKEVSICNGCGADITSDPWGHIKAAGRGSACQSYAGSTITITPAWSEQVLVSNAYYSCSCGATK